MGGEIGAYRNGILDQHKLLPRNELQLVQEKATSHSTSLGRLMGRRMPSYSIWPSTDYRMEYQQILRVKSSCGFKQV